LDDSFAFEFAKEFYKNLFDEKLNPEKDVPFALRVTQVKFLRNQVLNSSGKPFDYVSPYYWASRQYLGKQYSREKYLNIAQKDLRPMEAVVEIIRPKTEKDTYCVNIKTQKTIESFELGNEEDIQSAVNYESNVIRLNRGAIVEQKLAFFEQYWKPIDIILQSQNIQTIYFAPSGAFLHGSRDISSYNKMSSEAGSPYTININAFYDRKEKKYLIQKYNIIYLY
jgi:CHAT domain-containing protein